jgi:hypothetical protein
MEEQRLKKLGIEKAKSLNKDFDKLYEVYKKKALEAGYTGELRFINEHGRVFIYVVHFHQNKKLLF